jgi:hypothetical protein
MYRLPLIRILLSPSLSGGLGVLLGAAGAILFDIWPTIRYTTSVNAYVFGQYGARTLLLQSQDRLSLLRSVLHGSLVYYILVVVAGMSVGLVMYAFLESVGWARSTASEAMQDLHEDRQKHDLLRRQGLRIFCLVTWGIYTLFFITIMVPFSLSLAEYATNISSLFFRVCSMAAAGVILAIGLHLHVIFARLSLLRIRIFGGNDVMVEYGQ